MHYCGYMFYVDGDKGGAAKKRRKHSSSDKSPLASPGMKPALTERQQLALVMQMTTPQRQEGGRVEAVITPGSSGKGKLHRRNERGKSDHTSMRLLWMTLL